MDAAPGLGVAFGLLRPRKGRELGDTSGGSGRLGPRLDEILARVQAQARGRAESFRWDPHDGASVSQGARARLEARPAHPLRIVLADRERTLFQLLDDPRVTVMGADDGVWDSFDILVVPRADRSGFELGASQLPAQAWARIANGQARVVFDASGEGSPHKALRTATLHGLLSEKRVQISHAAYVTQDRGYGERYRAHCQIRGLDGPGMQVWVYDQYIQRTFAAYLSRGERVFAERMALFAARPRRRDRRFISLNNTLRPIKALFLLRLLEEGLWDLGFISLGTVRELNGGRVLDRAAFRRELESLPGFADVLPQWAERLDELEALGPIRLGEAVSADTDKAFRRALLDPAPMAEYGKSWFTVVTESVASDRLHRITEKPFKPLLNFHPMVVLGGTGSLRLIRSYGFETYPRLFDESYDETPKVRDRFDQVFAQVARLSSADEETLALWSEAATQTLLFNAWWGLAELPRLFRSRIDASLVDRIVDFAATD
jgi:hypothetical protein